MLKPSHSSYENAVVRIRNTTSSSELLAAWAGWFSEWAADTVTSIAHIGAKIWKRHRNREGDSRLDAGSNEQFPERSGQWSVGHRFVTGNELAYILSRLDDAGLAPGTIVLTPYAGPIVAPLFCLEERGGFHFRRPSG
eukprot:813588-Prymnesium_polylepis.1